MRYTRYTRYCVAEHLIYEETVDWNEIISSQQQQYKPGQGRVEVLVHHLIQSEAQELSSVKCSVLLFTCSLLSDEWKC